MHVRSGKTNIFVLDENWVDQNKRKKWIDYQISAVEVTEQFPTSSRSEINAHCYSYQGYNTP